MISGKTAPFFVPFSTVLFAVVQSNVENLSFVRAELFIFLKVTVDCLMFAGKDLQPSQLYFIYFYNLVFVVSPKKI